MEYECIIFYSEWMPTNTLLAAVGWETWSHTTTNSWYNSVSLNKYGVTFRIKMRFYFFINALRRSTKLGLAVTLLTCIRRCLVRISTGTQAILIQVPRASLQSLQVNQRISS
jgi:hypothetical protein